VGFLFSEKFLVIQTALQYKLQLLFPYFLFDLPLFSIFNKVGMYLGIYLCTMCAQGFGQLKDSLTMEESLTKHLPFWLLAKNFKKSKF
jgi:hypothetical protein